MIVTLTVSICINVFLIFVCIYLHISQKNVQKALKNELSTTKLDLKEQIISEKDRFETEISRVEALWQEKYDELLKKYTILARNGLYKPEKNKIQEMDNVIDMTDVDYFDMPDTIKVSVDGGKPRKIQTK